MRDKTETSERDPNKMTDLGRVARDLLIVEYAVAKNNVHYTYKEIAELMLEEHGIKVSRATVGNVISRHMKDWQEAIKENIENHKIEILQELEYIKEELWEDYYNSNESETTTIKEAVVSDSPTNGESKKREEKDTPKKGSRKVLERVQTRKRNSDILVKIQGVLDQKGKILGIYAPQKVEHSGKVQTDVVSRINTMSDAELLQLIQDNLPYLKSDS